MQTLTSAKATSLLRRVTMSELRSLLAIKSSANLTRAALELGVSQPALSQQLREVEGKLGMSLFVRHRRGLDATPSGEVMLRLAAALGVDMHIAAQELALAARQNVRPLRVGSMAVTSAGLLAVALGRFAAQSPTTTVVVMEGSREILLEHLRHRSIDIFVGRIPADASANDLVSDTLLLDSGVVITSARHPLVRRTQLRMEQLHSYGWIMPAEDTTFYKQIALSMRTAGLSMPAARIQSYSMLAIPAVVATSELLGFLPTSMFASGALSAGLHRLPVEFDWIASPVGVLTRTDAEPSDSLTSLIQILKSVAASARGALVQR